MLRLKSTRVYTGGARWRPMPSTSTLQSPSPFFSKNATSTSATRIRATTRRPFATTTYPPHTKITLPALSPTMSEGGLAKWKKKEGDSVKPGDALCEIETDKATVDYEMQEEGYLARILVKEGTTGLKVGSLIGILVEEKDAVGKFADYKPEAAPAGKEPDVAKVAKQQTPAAPLPSQQDQMRTAPKSPQSATSTKARVVPQPKDSTNTTTPTTKGGRLFASPLAKTLAREAKVEIGSVAGALKGGAGSGPNGRIVADDVRWALSSGALASDDGAALAALPDTAKEWALNKLFAPHFYLNVDVDLSELLRIRSELAVEGGKEHSVASSPSSSTTTTTTSIPLYAFILKASAHCMRTVPEANACWTTTQESDSSSPSILFRNHVDVVVLASEEGRGSGDLMVQDVNEMGLEEIGTKLRSFTSSDFNSASTSGTFSVVNVGGYGVKSVVPIVRPGHSTALGVGAVRKVVLPSPKAGEEARIAPVVTLTLSCDHRVVDGAIGAKWIAALKTYLESPMKMLL